MVLDLTKGMTLDLTKIENASGLTDVAVGVNWGQIKKGGLFGFGAALEAVDLDLSALLYDKNGKLVDKIFFGNKIGKGIEHSGDDLTGDSSQDDKDNETITVKLADTAPDVTKIVFVLVSFRGQDFGDLPYAAMNLYNTSSGKVKLANSNIDISKDSKYKGKVTMVFAALEKVNGSFSYRMIAEPTDKKTFGDLFSVCKNI
jgi:tellurium resistance protein TerZ